MVVLDELSYDVVIFGTDFVCSLLSLACSLSGKRVLHLDQNRSYGSSTFSLSVSDFSKWINSLPSNCLNYVPIHNKTIDSVNGAISDFSEITPAFENGSVVINSLNDRIESNLNKKFFIDINFRPVLSNGLCIESIKKFCKNYIEFTAIESHYLFREDHFVKIPMSKSDLFKSKLSLLDKKNMGRFLRALRGNTESLPGNENSSLPSLYGVSAEISDCLNKPIDILFQRFEMSKLLIDFVRFGVLQADSHDEVINTFEALPKLKLFFDSVGVYHDGAYLYPLYGLCDIIQSFCRASSVNGATFVLGFPLDKITDGDKVKIFCSNGQTLDCNKFVSSLNFSSDKPSVVNSVCRSVLITDKSLIENVESFVADYPPKKDFNLNSVRLAQLSWNQAVTPKDYYLIHLSSKRHENSENEMKKFVEEIFREKDGEEKRNLPKILFFAIYYQNEFDYDKSNLKNVFMVNSDVSFAFEAACRDRKSVV